ncbi:MULTISPECIES: glycoside hydrolase family 13 protein [Psychrilyobacter]|uniref:Alpha,alpha-phosphotrehalase n=1 Tax=Psychrilyobacter piezotolerans TaxID=2293438 RepID=A0ABX9KG65_9FUSO|nr:MULTISPECIES: alpha-glucosidase [Psychrilyobacter]MCS5420448.1 alpha-glucosidase [Psychrilyobacter sp. S5]NDI78227.1 alpha-glucosidase [Psychrilyobacter piezotolerans]RDE61213.1 alpha-glucosidase [Psychrilyobacter sp. S5]REI40881.1 alpha,alpha-phosphotrehalase [Psychrilyobacter piezotolerans]
MEKRWWKEAVGYQVYPRSFKDSTGNGIGDLRGLISKLDYLKELGIDIIWICPMYKSPNDDNGYDISDYKEILEEFGTMGDFDDLLKEIHRRDMKLIIDLVINHTSDEHEWFIESSSSKDNPKRDWYIWRDGKGEKEPNNWESIFSGSAWEHSPATDQYYLHLFSKKQPDLNWENKEVRNEIYNMINWWLDKGIDGFRVDAISHIKKEEGFEDMPNPDGLKYVSSFDKHMNQNGIHKYLDELKQKTFEKYDIVTVGEANGVSSHNKKDICDWVCSKDGKFNMIFQFEHLDLWNTCGNEEFDVKKYKSILSKWQHTVNDIGWNALYIENHDIPRSISTLGDDEKYRIECAKSFGAMYFLQKGTPFIYQGQEIGMTNISYPSMDDYQDVRTLNEYRELALEGKLTEEDIEKLKNSSRDNARTPMQWDNSENGGFTTGTPWLKLNENNSHINVKKDLEDEDSILNFYKKMIDLRKHSKEILYGDYRCLLESDENIYSYTREKDGKGYIIICNLTEKTCEFKEKNYTLNYENLVLNNYGVEPHNAMDKFLLKPYECRVYKLK